MRTHTAAIGIFTAAMASACFFHDDPTDPTTTSTSTGSSTGEPTTGPQQCPQSCPFPPPPCHQTVCKEGACDLAFLPEGTILPGQHGDCRHDVCDGAGGVKSVFADDPPAQTPGDCRRNVCESGAPVVELDEFDVPNDSNDCTDDACVDGVPTHTPRPIHTPCGPGGAHFCHDTGECQPCKQVTDACEDYGDEPHDNQETAYNLGTIKDNDSDGSYVCGTLKGANDIDWYTFGGDDAFLNYVDPYRSLVTQNGGGGRVCVYIECNNGATSLDCDGATSDIAPLGQKGCCSTSVVAPKLNCAGLDDSARVWIRLDSPQDLACVPYQLDYHF